MLVTSCWGALCQHVAFAKTVNCDLVFGFCLFVLKLATHGILNISYVRFGSGPRDENFLIMFFFYF